MTMLLRLNAYVPAALAVPVTIIWFCPSGFAVEMRLAHRATIPL
jgi:hypothetical protein